MDDTKYVIVCDMFAGERAVLLDSGITQNSAVTRENPQVGY